MSVHHPFDPEHPNEVPSPSVFRPFDPRNPTEIETLLLEKAVALRVIPEQTTVQAYQSRVEEVLLSLIRLTGLKGHNETTLRVDREFHERRLTMLKEEQIDLTRQIEQEPESYMLLFRRAYNQVYIKVLEERCRVFWEGGDIGEALPYVVPTQGAIEAEGSLFKTAAAWTMGLMSGTVARKSQAVYVVMKGLPFFSISPTDIPAVEGILKVVREALGTIVSSIARGGKVRLGTPIVLVPRLEESKVLARVFKEYNERTYNSWGDLFLRSTDDFFTKEVKKLSDYKRALTLEGKARELAIAEEKARREPALAASSTPKKEGEQQRYLQMIRDFQECWGGSTVDQVFTQQKEEWDKQRVRIRETLARIAQIRQFEQRLLEEQGERADLLEEEAYNKRFQEMQEEMERAEADLLLSKDESLRAIEGFFSSFSSVVEEREAAFRGILEKLRIFEGKILEAQTQDELRIHNISVLERLIGEMHERVQSVSRYKQIVAQFYEEKWGGLGIETVFAQEKEKLDAQRDLVKEAMSRIEEIRGFARQLSEQQSSADFELVEEWEEPNQRLQTFDSQIGTVVEALRVLKNDLLETITEFFSSSSSGKTEREASFQRILERLRAFEESVSQEVINYELRGHQIFALERLINEAHGNLESRVKAIDSTDDSVGEEEMQAIIQEFRDLTTYRETAERRIQEIQAAAQEQVTRAESVAEQQVRAALEQKEEAERIAEEQVRAAWERVRETERRAEETIQRIKEEAEAQLRASAQAAQEQMDQTRLAAEQQMRAAESRMRITQQKTREAEQRIRQLEEEALPRRVENVGRVQRRARSVLPSEVLVGMVSHMLQVVKEVKQSIISERPEDSQQFAPVEQQQASGQEMLEQPSSAAQEESLDQISEFHESTPESSILRDQIDRIIPRLQSWILTAVEEIGRSFAVESQVIRASIENVYLRARSMSSKESDWSEVVIPPTKVQSVDIDAEEILPEEEKPFEQSIHAMRELIREYREEAKEVETLVQEVATQLTAEIPLLFHSILTNALLHNRPEIEIQEMVARYIGRLEMDGEEDEITAYFKAPNAGQQATTLIRAMQTGIQTPGSVVDRYLKVVNVSQEERASIMKDMEEEMDKAHKILGSLTAKARVNFLERFHPANTLFREVMRPTRTRSSRAQVRATAPVRTLISAY